jgi:4-hydroxybutyrate CoA-transferase
MTKVRAASAIDDIVRGVPPGARIVAGPGCGTPLSLLRGLGRVAESRMDWTLSSALLLGDLGFVDAVTDGRLDYRTWHVVEQTRDLVAAGRAGFLPLRASEVPRFLTADGVDVLLVRVSPPDRDGNCSLGTSVSYPGPVAEFAPMIIGEVDPDFPHTEGRSTLPVAAFHALVESEDETPLYRSRTPDDVAVTIARHITELLPREPLLQIGIGEIPEAITPLLADADLGGVRFVGLGVDGMVDLFERGVVRPSSDPARPALRAVEIMGTRRILDFVHRNPEVGVYPVGIAGDALTLGHEERFVSIVSALQIDLQGQVNSERIGGRQIAGVGGALDFVDSARSSVGGVRIVALRSSSRGLSRIVPALEPGAPVSVPRSAVDLVVTEHGVARLGGLDLRQRAEALIAIADPAHHDALHEALAQQYSVR